MLSKTFDAGSHRVTVRTRLVPNSYMRSSFAKWWPGDVFISVVVNKVLYKDIGFIRRSKGFNLDFYYWEFDYDDCPVSPFDTYQECRKYKDVYVSMETLFQQACDYVKLEVERREYSL